VSVASHLQPDLPPLVGSTQHLLQVLSNLVHHAMESMPHGGRIVLRTACEYVAERTGVYDTIPEGDYVVLTVADDGVGITPSDMEHIFEPFYTKKAMGRTGSGLGLPVVYGVVKDLKGYVDVTTQESGGTQFSLFLPIAQAHVGREHQREVIDFHGTETILVVDDVAHQREVAERILSSLGYRVVSVASGREAVDHIRHYPVDLVVLDMILQEKFDGLDTYREILQVRPGMPCVIVSGFSETQRVKRAQALGAGPYVRKPYTRARLGRAVREELDHPTHAVA
jgi:CheY-like chemotaxis protein